MISSESCPVCQVAGLICWDPGSPRRAGRSRMLPRGVGETGREWSCRPPRSFTSRPLDTPTVLGYTAGGEAGTTKRSESQVQVERNRDHKCLGTYTT